MKKRMIAMVVAVLMGFSEASAVCASEVDNSERIMEIENQIASLQEELNELKKQQLEQEGGQFISSSEYVNLFSNADNYKDQPIQISGRMFGAMEEDDKAKYFQMFYDLNGDNKSVIVQCDKTTENFADGDYLRVTGKVLGRAAGKNAFGGDVVSVSLVSELVEKIDYAEAMNPALKTMDVNLPIDQFGYVIQIDKLEFAENETRVHMTITNNGLFTFNFSSYSMKIVQGTTQYEMQYNYDADYTEPQSEILPGTTTSGIVAFPKMDENTSITLYVEGHSDNWDEDVKMYQFNIEI